MTTPISLYMASKQGASASLSCFSNYSTRALWARLYCSHLLHRHAIFPNLELSQNVNDGAPCRVCQVARCVAKSVQFWANNNLPSLDKSSPKTPSKQPAKGSDHHLQ